MAGPGVQQADLKMLQDLAYVIGLRGTDAAGIFQGKTNDNWSSNKPAKYFISKGTEDINYQLWFHLNSSQKEANDNYLNDIMDNFFAVHTRAATRGALTAKNAHPFDTYNFLGMHNGTLVDKKYYNIVKTDSELFIKDISKRGITPVLSELDPNSAYALVLFDKKSKELVFACNGMRPLYVAFNVDRGVMYWASEAWMLLGCAARNGIKLMSDISQFKPGYIHRVNPEGIRSNNNKVFKVETFTLPERVTSRVRYPPNNGPYRRTWEYDTETEENKNKILKLKTPTPNSTTEDRIIYNTCAGCNAKMGPVERYLGLKMAANTYICEVCNDINKETERKVG